ncbi:MAG: methyltransferase domain-containing protein [Euryarchaeota archaeon]|nr:methyltransferase domain-containing protein [Euryarchaeota archaeon]
MTEIAFLFELSGEHPTLPRAEAISCVEAECGTRDILAEGPGYLICRFSRDRLDGIGERIALTHRIGPYLGSCTPDGLKDFLSSISIPEGSAAVRVRRFGHHLSSVNTSDVVGKVGGALAKKTEVNLEDPDIEVRVIMSDALHFFISDRIVDRRAFERRKVALRPFFSPISLHPRYARALVNLARVREGESVLDPFCGTGGILIEAGLIGARVFGSDISEEMIEGCKENIRHFGVRWEEMRAIDIGEIAKSFGLVDAVVTDPPYGRSATTRREQPRRLYERAITAAAQVIRAGGSLGAVFPTPCAESPPLLELRETHSQRVHRSLTRHYCLFTRTP